MELTITGGEPLLEEASVCDILDFSRKSAIAASLNSNLNLLTERMVSVLAEHTPAVLTSLFSWHADTHDGITGSAGSQSRTINGIQALLRARVPVSVNMVVTPANVKHVYDTGSFVHDLGVRTFTAVRASPPVYCTDKRDFILTRDDVVRTLDDLVRLHEDFSLNVGNQNCYPLCMLDDWGRYDCLNLRNCGAGVFHCTVGADGRVRPCVQGDMFYGDLLKEQLSDIWTRMQPWRDGAYLPQQCSRCKFVRQCTGGCRSDSRVHGESMDALDFYAKEGPPDVLRAPTIDRPLALLSPRDRVFVPRLKYRREKFGVLVALFHRQSRQVLVSHYSADVLRRLQENTFALEEIISDYGLEESSTLTFFSYLAVRRIVARQ
jgi:radical SAM protein with 4Fe4S-binding SPASM domain